MAKWNENGEWEKAPPVAVLLAEYLLTPKSKRLFPTKKALADECGVSSATVGQLERSKQFGDYLNYCRTQQGLDDHSMVEAAKLELWRKGMDGDTKALEQFLRMKGEFAAEKVEITHTDARDMTTQEIEAELQRILTEESEV